MNEIRHPETQRADCGPCLRLPDFVIVSREVVPPWAVPAEHAPTATVYLTRESVPGNADHNGSREPAETLAHGLTSMTTGGDVRDERGSSAKLGGRIASLKPETADLR